MTGAGFAIASDGVVGAGGVIVATGGSTGGRVATGAAGGAAGVGTGATEALGTKGAGRAATIVPERIRLTMSRAFDSWSEVKPSGMAEGGLWIVDGASGVKIA